MAARMPASGCPMNIQFLAPSLVVRIACSVRLLLMGVWPCRTPTVNLPHVNSGLKLTRYGRVKDDHPEV